jgi:hypothetical protein
MKNVIKVLALSMVVVLSVLMLVSCSTYGKIEKAFVDGGYTLQNADKEATGTIKTENGEITYTIHTFQKEGEGLLGGITQGLSTAIVWEFSSDADLMAAIEESETLKGLIKDAQNSDYVNGNCVLTTINPEAVEIFKGTK